LPHKLIIVVTVGSPLALQSLNGTNLISKALSTAHQFSIETSLSNRIFVAGEDISEIKEATKELSFDFATLEVDPKNSGALAKAISDLDFEMVAIHDSQRPLTRSTQFHRALEGLFGCDAVRPTSAFTETLKTVGITAQLEHTLDRTKFRRVSSPEVIRRSVIDFAGNSSDWALPLLPGARLSTVEADPDSLRINSAEEVSLLEAFLHWQQKISN
jgi:hypothetical protein